MTKECVRGVTKWSRLYSGVTALKQIVRVAIKPALWCVELSNEEDCSGYDDGWISAQRQVLRCNFRVARWSAVLEIRGRS